MSTKTPAVWYKRDFTGEGKTSWTGENLYAHPSQHEGPGGLIHMYYATRKTTLLEATRPFQYVGFFLLVAMVLDVVLRKYTKKYLSYKWLSTNGRMNWYLFAVVVLLFSVDDVGTSIGLQATETPKTGFEMNSGFCVFMEYMIINGYTATHTSGFRLVWIVNLLVLCTLQYFGLFGPLTSLYIVYTGLLKATAGYGWWGLKPNEFTIADFLLFRPGKVTPDRMGFNANKLANLERQGLLVDRTETLVRRKLLEGDDMFARIKSMFMRIFNLAK